MNPGALAGRFQKQRCPGCFPKKGCCKQKQMKRGLYRENLLREAHQDNIRTGTGLRKFPGPGQTCAMEYGGIERIASKKTCSCFALYSY